MTTAAAPAATTSAQPIATPQARVRHEWYQTDAAVVVSVFIKNAKSGSVRVDITERTLSVGVQLPTGSEYTLELDLAHAVDPKTSKYEVLSTKIEITLHKVEQGLKWAVLEGEDTAPATTLAAAAEVKAALSYPSSSRHGPKDWDKLGKEAAKEEDKPDALNALFQQIFAGANEETKRAMIKSYTESNGTCLSTNWEEVSKGTVETKPPEGMVALPYNR
ncbi:Cochaperone protein [Allomyces javanicus]|nr:Cochaperone protein [Allomyces javanicus]